MIDVYSCSCKVQQVLLQLNCRHRHGLQTLNLKHQMPPLAPFDGSKITHYVASGLADTALRRGVGVLVWGLEAGLATRPLTTKFVEKQLGDMGLEVRAFTALERDTHKKRHSETERQRQIDSLVSIPL